MICRMSHNPFALTNWIHSNRTGIAFKGYTWTTIAVQVIDSMRQGVFLVSHSTDNYNGVVCGRRDDVNKILQIDDILTTSKQVLKEFISKCHDVYPDYMIRGTAHGRARYFMTPKQLLNKL